MNCLENKKILLFTPFFFNYHEAIKQELERQGVIETIRAKGTFIARKVELQADDRKLSALHQSLRSIALELKMMGYTKEQAMELMAETFEEI